MICSAHPPANLSPSTIAGPLARGPPLGIATEVVSQLAAIVSAAGVVALGEHSGVQGVVE